MIRALALNCTLKTSPATSSTELLADQVLAAIAGHGAQVEQVRVVDLDVKPGVDADMGDGDQWPDIRAKILDADILVVCSPTWMVCEAKPTKEKTNVFSDVASWMV